MRIPHYLARQILFLLLGTLQISQAAGSSADCPAELEAPQDLPEADRSVVCHAVGSALDYFAGLGIDAKKAIRIRLHDDDLVREPRHIGSYDTANGRIDLVSQRHALVHCAQQSPFKVPMDTHLYHSFVVHEVAHAIAAAHFRERPRTALAPEYLAYAVQFATMQPALREQILAGYDVEAFNSFDDMSCIYYQLAPDAFAVKAWKHFAAQPDPGGFIRGLLAGQIEPSVATDR